MPFVENRGARLFWDEAGSGEPLLLINGLGTTSHQWQRFRPLLARHHRTLALDNRGTGRSDVPAGAYPIELLASDAVAVLDAAEAVEAHVMGVSLGGMIAQELALRHPSRVRSLILGCTMAGEPTGPHAIQPRPEVLQALARPDLTPEESNAVFAPLLYHASTPRARIDEELAIRTQWHPHPLGYLGQVQGVSGWDAYDRLPHIEAPTLIVHGEDDPLIPPGNAAILAERIAGAKVVMIPAAMHVFWTDQPQATCDAILEFLAAHARRASARGS